MAYNLKKQKYENGERYTEYEFTINVSDGGLNFPTVSWDKCIQLTDDSGKLIPTEKNIIRRAGPRKNKIADKIISQALGTVDIFDAAKCKARLNSVYGIDSNTHKIDNKYITIGVVAKMDFVQETESSGILLCDVFGYLESVNTRQYERIEPFMWRYGIERIIQKDKQDNIGIVVDSDLGNLIKYNEREIPVHDDFFLPDSCNLIYASSDVIDNWANKLLKFCDKEANQLFKTKYRI